MLFPKKPRRFAQVCVLLNTTKRYFCNAGAGFYKNKLPLSRIFFKDPSKVCYFIVGIFFFLILKAHVAARISGKPKELSSNWNKIFQLFLRWKLLKSDNGAETLLCQLSIECTDLIYLGESKVGLDINNHVFLFLNS